MNWEAIGAIGEILGAVGVIATIGYLAIQIRQNTRTQQSAIAQATTASRTSWYDLVISDPEIGDIWRKGNAEPDLLTEQERSRFIWMLARIFSNLEEFYLQFQHGMLPEDQWLVYRGFGRTMLENPIIDDWWESGMAVFIPSFVADLAPESQRAEWTAMSAKGTYSNKASGDDAQHEV
jgi:hypothetical protein